MPETKPFISYPVWRSSKHNRLLWRPHYDGDMKRGFSRFSSFGHYFFYSRSAVRICKGLVLLILIITCLVNLKLTFDAKARYERHQKFLNFLQHPPISVDNVDIDFDKLYTNAKKKNSLDIEVVSSKDEVKVTVNGIVVVSDRITGMGRGLHVIVLNEFSGAVTSHRRFDTYTEGEDKTLQTFLLSLNDENRILIFTIKDEASNHLSDKTKGFLRSLGSKKVNDLQWRSMWVFIVRKKDGLMAEDIATADDAASWGNAVVVKANFKMLPKSISHNCNWTATPENKRRQHFCSKFDGYNNICNCDSEFELKRTNLTDNLVYNIPVVVIASYRPQYLYRMLTSVLSATGANPDKITVFIDGKFEEPMEIAKLLGVKGIYHQPVGVRNARISQNYKASLSAAFNLNPDAKYVIVLEEDLDVSPDFFSYFSQTLHLMDADPSIYCISAWNDQGYHHSCLDPEKLYRVESFPGLGWLLSRKLFEEELKPNWPSEDKTWDWDMWMRQPDIQKGRECIIPDVSRTFHFGSKGVNMNSYFHHLYFSNHTINLLPNVKLKDVDSLTKVNYENFMHYLVRTSQLVDHQESPCNSSFISRESPASSYVAYLQSDSKNQLQVFQELFKCLKVWDLSVRGIHKHAFRTYINKRHVVFVAYPNSPYSIYKPVNIKPILLSDNL